MPFGPLAAGGLVHARILTPDALAADNDRYALAPSIAQARALVLSPEASVRDDLARVVLAVNPNFLVTAMDPRFTRAARIPRRNMTSPCCTPPRPRRHRRRQLFVFPEPPLDGKPAPFPPVIGSVALAEFQSRAGAAPLSAPVLLGPSRVVQLPGWMDLPGAGGGRRQS